MTDPRPDACDFDKIGLPPQPAKASLPASCKECGKPLPERFIINKGVAYCPACDEAGGGE
jgi:hypothetical protein